MAAVWGGTMMRDSFDAAVGSILHDLAPDGSYDAERLLRLGAFPPNGKRLGAREAAARLGYSRERLGVRMRQLGLPGTATLMTWGSILRICAEWREDPSPPGRGANGNSLERLACAIGWSSYVPLSEAMVKQAGIRPRAWLEGGADMGELCRALVEQWRAKRLRWRH